MTTHQLKDGYYHVPIVDLGNRLQDNFGLTIVEHPEFGGVKGKHAKNSHHDYGEAIDIQDWRADDIDGVSWTQRTKNLETLLQGSGHEVIGPGSGDPGHTSHLHLGTHGGIFKLTAKQYNYLFGGKAGGKNSTFAFDPDADYGNSDGTVTHNTDGTPKDPDSPAQSGLKEYVTRMMTAKEAVNSLGNDFGSMKSSRLAEALSGAQESILQNRMNSGESFGTIREQKPTPTKPPTSTPNPTPEPTPAPKPTPTPAPLDPPKNPYKKDNVD